MPAHTKRRVRAERAAAIAEKDLHLVFLPSVRHDIEIPVALPFGAKRDLESRDMSIQIRLTVMNFMQLFLCGA